MFMGACSVLDPDLKVARGKWSSSDDTGPVASLGILLLEGEADTPRAPALSSPSGNCQLMAGGGSHPAFTGTA